MNRYNLGNIIEVLGYILGLIGLIAMTIYKFQNPDLTETRIFLNTWTWTIPLIIVFTGLVFVGRMLNRNL